MNIVKIIVFLFLIISNIYPQDIWEHLNFSSPNSDIPIMSIKQVRNRKYIGTNSGLYYSDDNYKSFQLDTNVAKKGIRKILGDSLNVFILSDSIYYSLNLGESWFTVPYYNYYTSYCTDIILTNDNVLVGGFYLELNQTPPIDCGMYFSMNYHDWNLGALQWWSFGTIWRISHIINDSKNNIYISAEDMYKLPANAFSIFISKDNGKTVSKISNGYPAMPVNSISVNKMNGDVYLCTDNGLYKYLTEDSTWTLFSLKNQKVRTLLVYTENIFYAIIDNFYSMDTIMVSTDQGINWKSYTSGLNNVIINTISIDSGKYLYAGTYNGLYRAKLANPVGTKADINTNVPKAFCLGQNYPNPCNPSTTIKYSISRTQFVSLKIFDMLGREIISLVNEEKMPGEYSVNFDGSNYPSGTYYYRIQAGNFILTKKLVLIK